MRIKAMHVAFSYHNNPCEDLTFYENELQKSLDRYYDLYIAFFTILFTIQRHAVDITEKTAQRTGWNHDDLVLQNAPRAVFRRRGRSPHE